MQGTRSELEGETYVGDVCITDYPTKLNRNQLNCGVCNGTFYTDDVTYHGIRTAIEQGLDNPFMCDACLVEYEESSVPR